jgi:hypothetical protein
VVSHTKTGFAWRSFALPLLNKPYGTNLIANLLDDGIDQLCGDAYLLAMHFVRWSRAESLRVHTVCRNIPRPKVKHTKHAWERPLGGSRQTSWTTRA